MGQTSSSMEQIAGTSNLRINQVVGSDQLLVKLCRNGSEWLSPIGWVSDEKGTLLDCKAEKSSSVVEIPAEFAKKLKAGDKITLTRPDSGFKSEVMWGQQAAASTTRKKTNGSTPSMHLSLEDTERRAMEAEKAAANYKAKMEAASHAREAAQAASLEAARKADEALKAEADRIAEMERAAKAFEEAEKLRLDGQRRLERERRLEEERIAEEARLAEEARIQAEAARLKKERAAARKNIKDQISKAKDEKTRLEDVLASFKSKADMAESELADNEKRLIRMEKSMATAQKEEAETKAALSKEENRLSDIASQSDKVSLSMRNLEKNNEKLFKNLEKAELSHQKALKEVDAARARAAESLKALNAVKADSDKIKSQQTSLDLEKQSVGEKLAAQKALISGLKTSFDNSRLTAEKEQSGLRELKKSQEALNKKLGNSKTDIARTLQDIKAADETLSRRKTSLKQIEDMENADEIRTLMGKAPQPVLSASKVKGPDITPPVSTEKGGFLGRFFRKAEPENRSAKPQTKPLTTSQANSKPVAKTASKPKSAPSAPVKKKTVSAEKSLTGSRLNTWLLLGVATAGMAALGTAYAFNNKAKSAGLVSSNDAPMTKLSETPVLVADAQMPPEALSLTTESAVTPAEDSPAQSEEPTETIEAAEKAAETEPQKTPAPKAVAVETPAPQTARVEPAAITPTPRPASRRADYQDVTKTVQENLAYLGMYSGAIDGLQTVQTQTAMRDFKTLYALPVNNDLSGTFVNTLKRAVEEQRQVREIQIVETPQNSVIQVASNEVSSVFTTTSDLNAISNNSVSISPPAIDPVQSVFETSAFEPAAVETPAAEPISSEPEVGVTEQFAELTLPSDVTGQDVITASIPADEIVPAKVVRKARAEYPERVLRADKSYDAKVYVTYDVNAEGRVENARIESMDYDGEDRFTTYFEKEAIKAVEGQRFDPRLVNGVAAIETARTTRISFNGSIE